MGNTFNQTNQPGSQGQQIAENHGTINQNQNLNSDDWRPPFLELANQVKDQSWPETTSEEIVERYETPSLAVSTAVEEIEKDLSRPDGAPTESEESFEARKKTWTETFQAMVPMGVKLTSAVGLALAGHFTKKTAAGVAAEAFFTTISEMQS